MFDFLEVIGIAFLVTLLILIGVVIGQNNVLDECKNRSPIVIEETIYQCQPVKLTAQKP